jgi:predicted enzyme related to lactoylglutathione lyase
VERVLGIGGVFIRPRDTDALKRWYHEHLGIDYEPWGGKAFAADEGDVTVWSIFAADTDYWPASQSVMVNFRVRDLDAMLEQLRSGGVTVADETHEDENGRFGWAIDPEGNRIELWQPARAESGSGGAEP